MGLAVAEAEELEHVHPGVHAGHYGHVAGRLDLEARIGEVDGERPVGCEELVGDGNVVGHGGLVVVVVVVVLCPVVRPYLSPVGVRAPGHLPR